MKTIEQDIQGKDIARVVIWFSGGVTSAIAAKIALQEYQDVFPCIVAMCDTGGEHEDNYRFTNDVSAWLDYPITMLKHKKFANVEAVYKSTGFMVSPYGAKCTTELKKKVRQDFENLKTDLQIFGYHANEKTRVEKFLINNPLGNFDFPLLRHDITHDIARQMLVKAGIEEPITYKLGFNNANCLAYGCVKGGMGYWNHIRRVFPEIFQRRALLERELNVAMLHEMVDGERRRVFLDELAPERGNYNTEPRFQCGLFCGNI